MAAPKVFVSSTCYDLSQIRHNMHSFLRRFGYEPILSEYSDVLFDPREHTHTNCVQDVKHADMVVLFIGSRFGGKAIPEALELIDWDSATLASTSRTALENKEKLSITQLEIISAIENGVPIFPFVEERVNYDHLFYEKNKGNPEIINSVKFPSIEKKDSAIYIFEFLNFLRHRTTNNSIISFSKFEEVENHLTKQWASLFQRLLNESLTKKRDQIRRDIILEKIENLETAVISTIQDEKTKTVARNAMRFRRLLEFLLQISINTNRESIYDSTQNFEGLMEQLGIVETHDIGNGNSPWSAALVCEDRTYFAMRNSRRVLITYSNDWADFAMLKSEERKILLETISEQQDKRIPFISIRYHNTKFEDDYPSDQAELQISLDDSPF